MIVDASVAAKWLLRDESDADLAQDLRVGDRCLAPDLIITEVANSCIKRVQRKSLSMEAAERLIRLIPGLLEHTVPTRDLIVAAGAIAARFAHPIYDCVYLALAQREGEPLVTVDRRLIALGARLEGATVVHLADL
jgi:predicted nucleic acid-binding protein